MFSNLNVWFLALLSGMAGTALGLLILIAAMWGLNWL